MTYIHTLFTFRVLTHFWYKPKIGWQYQNKKFGGPPTTTTDPDGTAVWYYHRDFPV